MTGDGWATYEPGPGDEGREMILPGCDLLIRRDHIPSYFTPGILSRLQIWVNWKAGLGLPRSGGWMDQPAKFIDVLDLLIAEGSKHNAARAKQDAAREAIRGRKRHR